MVSPLYTIEKFPVYGVGECLGINFKTPYNPVPTKLLPGL
jgi:hypothetical protein